MEEKELKKQLAEEEKLVRLKKLPSQEDKSAESERKMLLSAKILERMITQNIFSDIAFDFKYWEDRSDDYKELEGTLYPLWDFGLDETRQQVI